MRNTGILYSSTERKPVVLPELAELCLLYTSDAADE